MSWRLLSRSIYGAESRLDLPLQYAPGCARELRRSVTCTGKLSMSVTTTCCTCAPGGLPPVNFHLHRGCPTVQGFLCTEHRPFSFTNVKHGISDHTALYKTPMHHVSPLSPSMAKLLYGTRSITSSSVSSSSCLFSTTSVCRQGGWICQHVSRSLCQQQRRMYAKKGLGNCE